MNKKPTIQDIAEKAGVSPATVSRVLNNYEHISSKKRQRVEKAMLELDYRPSFTARHMRTQRSRLIGFLTDEVATTPYAGDIIRGAEEVTWNNNHILLVISAGDNLHHAEAAVNAMLEREVEGIIYAAMYHRPVRLPDNIYEAPTVLANCYVEDRSLPSVVPDEVQGGYDATMQILARGHQRVAFINLKQGIPASEGRLAGFKKALDQYGIPFDKTLIRNGNGQPDDGYTYTKELMSLANPPTALFCGNDRTAMGAYDALRKLKMEIPTDIGVMSFDNQEIIASALHPSLSTMQLPHYEMGCWAANYLIQHSPEAEVPVQQLLPCPYVERESL
ncbi:MAG: LacI family DNA-binding transcriptional regulator [Anaerolineae bacterium]